MDKELLRIVIIAIGITVIIGMILWSTLKNKKTRRHDIDFYDKGDPLNNIDDSLVLKTDNDDFDIVSIGSTLDDDIAVDRMTTAEETGIPSEQSEQNDLPDIIQFSLVSNAEKGFNGIDLLAAFQLVGLDYGSMKIFERLDEQNRVDFAVASMVEPGTFPETNLESFYSPGLVFFIQPKELDNPLEIFDEFIETFTLLAAELDGIQWDHNRKPLSKETIDQFRHSLANM